MTARTLYVIPVPSFDTVSSHPTPRGERLALRVKEDVTGLAARVTSVLFDVTAALYLLGHTIAETETAARIRGLFRRPLPEAPEPTPSKAFDVVDQASWESFPASDPPGY